MDLAYYIGVWAVAYGEAVNEDVYLPVPDIGDAKSYQQVLAILAKEHPDISFTYGLAPQDILHNALVTMVLERITKIDDKLRELDTFIRPLDKITIRCGVVTPVQLGPYLRSFLRHLRLVPPDFRLGGDNGELTVLKFATGVTSVKTLAKVWLRNVKTKLEFLNGFPDITIMTPTSKQNLAIMPTVSEKNLLSGISLAVNLRNLSRCLLQHQKKGLLGPTDYTRDKFPDIAHVTAKAFKSYKDLLALYESAMDGYLSVADFEYLFAWDSLYLVLDEIIDILKYGVYDPKGIWADLESAPECLTELLSYYSDTPPNKGCFGDLIAHMSEWDIVRSM